MNYMAKKKKTLEATLQQNSFRFNFFKIKLQNDPFNAINKNTIANLHHQLNVLLL